MRFKPWSKDRKLGAKTGDGFINAWRVVKQPEAVLSPAY
jgi:predicted lipoprotein with Yx(FWY)xxD motif